MTAPAPKHSTLFGQLYDWIGTRTFFRWPGPLTEALGAVGIFLLAVLVPLALRLVLTFLLMPRGIVLSGTALNVAYVLFFDPQKLKGEALDFPLREAVLVLLVLGAHALRVV